MIITQPEAGYFKLQSGNLTTLINPTHQRSFKGAILVLNTFSPSSIKSTGGELIWIEHQGEYEVKNIQVQGWSVRDETSFQSRDAAQQINLDKTVYRIIFENLKILILGDLAKSLGSDIQNHIQKPDIVLGPANLKITKWLKTLEPKLIIPALIKPSEIQEFLKEFGQKESKIEEKLTLKPKDLELNKTIIQCLKPSLIN